MRKWIVAVAVTATLFIAALVAVTFGVAAHTEPGLLEVCRSPHGVAVYRSNDVEGAPTGVCSNYRELVWNVSDIPLGVITTYRRVPPTPGELRLVENAVDNFNAQVGFRLFSYTELAADAAVTVVFDGPAGPEDSAGGCRHWLRPDGSPLSAALAVRNAPGYSTIFYVLLHELGHAVGLAHDDWAGSLMAQTALAGLVDYRPPARLTDYDRAKLRGLYMKL